MDYILQQQANEKQKCRNNDRQCEAMANITTMRVIMLDEGNIVMLIERKIAKAKQNKQKPTDDVNRL